jgi:hypothetical protein
MTIIKTETSILMVNCGVPEYSEASETANEEELKKIIEENIECVVKLPQSAKDYQ